MPDEIGWQFAPLSLPLAGDVELRLARGMVAVQTTEMRRFLAATGNALNGNELAVAAPADLRWFVVVALEQGPLQRGEWSEQNTESDGREVVIHTVLVPAGGRTFSFDLVAEKANAAAARRELEPLLQALVHKPPKTGEPRWHLPAGLVAVGIVLAWAVARRRQRGL